MNKNKKFNLKLMVKQSNKTSLANKFENGFNDVVKGFKNENEYDGENYKSILQNSKLTKKGKELKKRMENL